MTSGEVNIAGTVNVLFFPWLGSSSLIIINIVQYSCVSHYVICKLQGEMNIMLYSIQQQITAFKVFPWSHRCRVCL